MIIIKGSTTMTPIISLDKLQFGLQSVRIGLSMNALENLSLVGNIWTKILNVPLSSSTSYFIEFTDHRGYKYSSKFDDFTPEKVYNWTKTEPQPSKIITSDGFFYNSISNYLLFSLLYFLL